jgi:phage tail sheath gpL-like
MAALAKAVASSVKTPGLYLTIDLLGGASNPSSGALRILIMSPKNSSGGDGTANTEIRQVFGADDVADMLGAGNPGHLCAKRLFEHNGLAQVDVIAPTESAGAAATSTTTFTGPTTSNGTVRIRIHGRVIDVPWLSGESATTFVARAVLAINALSSDIFVTASQSTGDLILTAKSKGPWGNDVLIDATIIEGAAGGAVSVNPAALTGGTTEPDFTTALSNVDTLEYRRIILCLSNADATLATTSSNADRLKTHINSLNTGNQAKLQIGLVGHTGTTTNAKGGAVHRNEAAFQYVLGRSYEDLPAELAGAEAGDATRFIALRANYNRIGNKLNLYGPRDVKASKLTAAEVEDLLSNGVTPLDQEPATNEVFVVRPITTHSLNGANPDYRAFDMSDIDGVYTVAADLRSAVPAEFANCSISEDLEPNADPLPPGVVELKDVRAFYLARLEFWADEGVVNRANLRAKIAAGDFIFEIDSSDPTQVNNVLPFSIVKPLAKQGVVIRKVA